MSQEISPLPWVNLHGNYIIPAAHEGRKIGGSTYAKEDRDDFAHVICRIERNENRFSNAQASANAAFIVKACNSHDQIKAALKSVTDVLDAFGNMADGFIHPAPWSQHKAEEKIAAARAALAAAGAD